MKIYITRLSASEILFGGLERLRVWFEKPVYVERTIYDPAAGPFMDTEKSGCFKGGEWVVYTSGKVERRSVSFGCVFGYINNPDPYLNEIATYVWEELCKHFGSAHIDEPWEKNEQEGRSRIQDFFLEIDLSIKMKKPRKKKPH